MSTTERGEPRPPPAQRTHLGHRAGDRDATASGRPRPRSRRPAGRRGRPRRRAPRRLLAVRQRAGRPHPARRPPARARRAVGVRLGVRPGVRDPRAVAGRRHRHRERPRRRARSGVRGLEPRLDAAEQRRSRSSRRCPRLPPASGCCPPSSAGWWCDAGRRRLHRAGRGQLSALVGNQWGFATVWYGLLEGLGAEVVLALLLYRRWGLPTALLAGAGAGVIVGPARRVRLLPGLRGRLQGSRTSRSRSCPAWSSPALGGWALTRALDATGALAPLASAKDARRV